MPVRCSVSRDWLDRMSGTIMTWRGVLPMALCLSLLAASASVRAHDAADTTDTPQACASATLADWPEHLHQCQKSPAWLASLGELMLSQGQYQQALEHLERAIMLDPDFKGAQLGYALALAGSGDIRSAFNLSQALLQGPDLPEPLRAPLQRQVDRWLALQQVVPDRLLRVGLGLRVGYDSNLLGLPGLSQLSLTLPGQTLTLPLDSAYQRRPGSYVRADATVEAHHAAPDGQSWQGLINLRQRSSPALDTAGLAQGQAALEYGRPLPDLPLSGARLYADLNLGTLTSHDLTRYGSQGLGAGLQWSQPWPATAATTDVRCNARAGLDWQYRDMSSNPLLSGHYGGLGLWWGCEASDQSFWQLAARAGQDRPSQAARPGGEQTQLGLRASLGWPLPALGGQMLLDLELERLHDANGYSPWLENGSRRHVDRSTLGLELQRPVAAGVLGVLGLDWVSQQSNLPLFAMQSWGAWAGLRWRW